MFMYGSSLIIRFFVPCYFGNEIQHDYEEILRDVYNIDWVDANKLQKQRFMIIQENLKPKFQLRASKILPINLTSFMRILRSAYSLYTVLSQINN